MGHTILPYGGRATNDECRLPCVLLLSALFPESGEVRGAALGVMVEVWDEHRGEPKGDRRRLIERQVFWDLMCNVHGTR